MILQILLLNLSTKEPLHRTGVNHKAKYTLLHGEDAMEEPVPTAGDRREHAERTSSNLTGEHAKRTSTLFLWAIAAAHRRRVSIPRGGVGEDARDEVPSDHPPLGGSHCGHAKVGREEEDQGRGSPLLCSETLGSGFQLSLCVGVDASKGRVIAGNLVARVLANASPRRAVHASAYDKNVDDQVRPAFVPDDVIAGTGTPDKYWGPHPTTGVFGPLAVDPNLAAAAAAPATDTTTASVLDQKVWFRPIALEDVDKSHAA